MTDPAPRASFDSRAFFAALDAERSSRHLTWKDVAQQAGISASTLSRMSQGRRPDVDGLATLLAWSGLDVAAFIRSSQPAPSPATLTRITTELRADPLLSDDSASALEDIVRTAYGQLAARDAREGASNVVTPSHPAGFPRG
jgi:transcriptional regulator with XRE-family HTH domain